MIRALLVTACLAVPASAAPVDDHLAAGRALYDQRRYQEARDELLAAYQLEPRPDLLFALGQCELNLEHFREAIDYYERYIATQPGEDQVALAQQAIGAARARIAELAKQQNRPVLRRHWDTEDTVLAASGAAGVGLGIGLILYGKHRGEDRSGTLGDYDTRLEQAHVTQYVGIGCIAAGAIAAGYAIYRWRYHLVATEIAPIASPTTAGLSVVHRW